MMKILEVSKLVRLRHKTDMELLALIGKELNRALALATVAATRESPLFVEAEKIVEVMTKLVPTISGVVGREREALHAAIKEVRLALASVQAQRVQRRAASSSAFG